MRRLAEDDPRVRLIRHPVNQEYGAAVRDALWAAARNSLLYDSDRQFDIGEIDRFLPRIGEADLVIGYRYARSDPWHRRFLATAGRGW